MIQSLPVVARRHVDVPSDPSSNPKLQALRLINRDYLSYSAISTYQRCPLKFFFSYVAQLEPAFKSSSLIFGSAIHAAIEEHFVRLMEGRSAPIVNDLLEVFDRTWNSESTIPIRFGKSETADSLRDLAGRMLNAFADSELSKLDGELLGVEETFRGPIAEDCPDLLGRIDLLAQARYALRIIDFKTSRSAWNDANIQDAATQQLLYSELTRPLAEALELPIEVNWVVLTKTKSPTVTRHELKPDRKQTIRAKAMVRAVWHSIQGGHFYPNPSTANCLSCPYRTACNQWEGESHVDVQIQRPV